MSPSPASKIVGAVDLPVGADRPDVEGGGHCMVVDLERQQAAHAAGVPVQQVVGGGVADDARDRGVVDRRGAGVEDGGGDVLVAA
jgi:hypothetical protein